MVDKIGAVDTAMDDIRGYGISSAGYNRYMGNVVLVEQIMSTDMYSKLTEVIEQVPRDVLYGFCCSYAQGREEG